MERRGPGETFPQRDEEFMLRRYTRRSPSVQGKS